ncbi:DNA-3-methyladenine glycosylase family protein [Actinomadura xylanilytica]|uniref:DNA-3-methyladenine glycosylase family protein n=1 Tax=Actinomadura xylanilytica TaxID=887459 RepID=UPI00255B1413|nr:DNA-3-methyladenine glycosylase 2 family protein [Actinomadura xylanilytica]MDL4776043.1 DNA-3-methyladenine glycosylase 2 family protein [Actinomadura xylanilytica]
MSSQARWREPDTSRGGAGEPATGRVARAEIEAERVREWRAPWPVDPVRVLGVHRRGRDDPAFRTTADGAVWRASHTPDGPGTLRVRPSGDTIIASAWGPGAGWLLDGVPDLLGAADLPEGLEARHDVVRDAARRAPGLRIGRTGRVFEALVPAVLEQKVLATEAHRAWAYLLRRFGEPAPGAPGMRVPPPPSVWIRIPSWEWHRSGAEAVRARTIIGAARVAGRLEADPAEARLRTLPGIGVWTAAEIRQRAAGDPDAVSVGDYNLPGLVGWALVGRKVDDAGMLELLEPYAGHRYRVTRLLESTGRRPPRRGPRLPVRDYRSF